MRASMVVSATLIMGIGAAQTAPMSPGAVVSRDVGMILVLHASGSRPSQHAIDLYNRASILKAQGRTDEAITLYKQALVVHPGFTHAHYNPGRAYYEKASRANGIHHENQFPTDGSPMQEYLPRWEKGREWLDLAQQEFEKLVKIEPDAADVYSMLGLVLHNKGEYDKAIEFNNRAIELDPKGLDGQDSRQDNALILHFIKKRKDIAIQLLRENLRINPGHETSRQTLRLIDK